MKLISNVVIPLEINFSDYPDNSSTAISVYFIGCSHNCDECQNKELQNDYEQSLVVTTKELYEKLEYICYRNRTKKVIFTGGDPLHNNNRQFVKEFLQIFGDRFEICIYTGYNISDVKLIELQNFKFIKAGKYIKMYSQESIKNDVMMQLASSNQEFYDSNYKQISQNGILYFE